MEKINATRFCDLQGVSDTDRNIIERKYRKEMALYSEWYATLSKEGFEFGKVKDFTPKKEATDSSKK